MSLFISSIVQEGSTSVSRDQLFNSKKLIEFKTISSGNTRFKYLEREDRQVPPDIYVTELSRPAFEALAREADNEPFVWVNVLTNEIGQPVNEMRKFAVDRIVKGIDVTTYHCDLWVDEGFRLIKYRTSHTITEISQAASQSVSLSPSE